MTEERDIEVFSKITPPSLEGLLGYRGTRKWVAFFWGKKIGNSTLCHGFDGKTFNPVNLTAWNAFFNHSLIVAMNRSRESGNPHKRFMFGDDQTPSVHWLLMDRSQRILYAARKEKALSYVRVNNESLEINHSLVVDPSLCTMWDSPDRPAEVGMQKINDMLQWLDAAMLKLQNHQVFQEVEQSACKRAG